MSSSDDYDYRKPRRKKRVPKEKSPKRKAVMPKPKTVKYVIPDRYLDPSEPSTSGYRPGAKNDEFSTPSTSGGSQNFHSVSSSDEETDSCVTYPASIREEMLEKDRLKKEERAKKMATNPRYAEQERERSARRKRWKEVAKANKHLLKPHHYKPYNQIRNSPMLKEFLHKKRHDPEFRKSLYERARKAKPFKIFSDDELPEEPLNIEEPTTPYSDTLSFDTSKDHLFESLPVSDPEMDAFCDSMKGKLRSSWSGGPLPDECFGCGISYQELFNSDEAQKADPELPSSSPELPAFMNLESNKRSKKKSKNMGDNSFSAIKFKKFSKKALPTGKRLQPNDSDSESESAANYVTAKKVVRRKRRVSKKSVRASGKRQSHLVHDSSPEDEEIDPIVPKSDEYYVNKFLGGRIMKLILTKLPETYTVSSSMPASDKVDDVMEVDFNESFKNGEKREELNSLPEEECDNAQLPKISRKKLPKK